jgi:serine/threonine protein kinase
MKARPPAEDGGSRTVEAQPKQPAAARKLTSEDLFGELVDAPAAAQPSADAAGVKTPIKVRIRQAPADPVPEAVADEIAALLDAIPAGDARPQPPPAASAPSRAALAEPETPTKPMQVDPLPDLAEFKESQHEAEAISDLLQLTSKLKPASPADATQPSLREPAQTAQNVDLASVAADALEDGIATGGAPHADAVLPEPEPARPADGLTYGPYRLLEKIAVGGMAEVFKAKRSGVAGFEKIVAVKRILPHLSYNNEFVEMFVDEAKMVAGLQHPNIVQIFDLGRIGSSYYIAMEYVHGADLRSILKRLKERELRMPLDVAVFIAGKVAAALEHAHQKKDAEGRPMKIVHRDVSPQNILISYDGEVKLTDFGIAKAATKASTTEKGALRGKLMYMSPEQAWGRSMDHRSDLFSLGIVLYEMITDQRPFLGSSDMSLLEKVRRGTVSPPREISPDIPEPLERFVMKALQKEPDARHRDAGAMHQEIEQVIQDSLPVSAKDLARFMRILFDSGERADAREEAAPPAQAPGGLELELLPADSGAHVPTEPMTIERLLQRFDSN